jgi:hypothetical protein
MSGENVLDTPNTARLEAQTGGKLPLDLTLHEVTLEINLGGGLTASPTYRNGPMERDPQLTLQAVADALGWDTAAMLLVTLNFIASQGHACRIDFAAYLDTLRAEEEAFNTLPPNHVGA